MEPMEFLNALEKHLKKTQRYEHSDEAEYFIKGELSAVKTMKDFFATSIVPEHIRQHAKGE